MRQLAWTIVALGLVSTPAMAQETTGSLGLVRQSRTLIFAPTTLAAAQTPAAAPDEPKKVTTIVGVDFPTAYFFRGYLQEKEGFIAQPFVDVGIAASDTTTVNVGMWNSFHSSDATGAWYETDFYGMATFVTGKWKPAVLFTSYNYPSFDWEGTINEIAAVVAYDDSDKAVPLAPKVILAVELREGNKTYFEFGVTPAVAAGPATVSVPVKIGLSLHDYYPDAFGYFQVGAKVGGAIPTSGSMSAEVHAGVDIIVPSEGIRFDKKAEPVVNVGFSLTF